MHFTKNLNGNQLTVALEGRLDTVTAPELDADLKTSMESVDSLILDLTNLAYISSAGLRVLLNAHKAMSGKGGMKIVHANEIVREVLEVTGFADILNIE